MMIAIRVAMAAVVAVMMMAPVIGQAQQMGEGVAPSAPVANTAPAASELSEVPKPKPAIVIVTLETAEGPIVLALEKERAPLTTKNFLRYVDTKRLDGVNFYRAVNMSDEYGLVQAGVRDPRKLFPPIAHEPTSQTGLSHVRGAVSMARAAEGTARNDFFILAGDMTALDANPDAPGDNSGFAVFGHVLEGMDVVVKIMKSPISPTLGAKHGMQGQMLANPVRIVSARRTPDYKPSPPPETVPAPSPDDPEPDTGAQIIAE